MTIHSLRSTLLYIIEALSYITMTTIAVFMLKRLGYSNGIVSALTGATFSAWILKPFIKQAMSHLQHLEWMFTLSHMGIILALWKMHTMLLQHNGGVWAFFICLWLMVLATVVFSSCKEVYIRRHISNLELVTLNHTNNVVYHIILIVGQGMLLITASFLEIILQRVSQAWADILAIIIMGHSMMLVAMFCTLRRRQSEPRNMTPYQHRPVRQFIQQEKAHMALLFLYLLPNICILRLRPLFFIDMHQNGGLELTLFQIGLLQGTVGIIAFTIGHVWSYKLLAHGYARHTALVVSLWSIPPFMFLAMSLWQPESNWAVGTIVAINQLCIGIGINLIARFVAFSKKMIPLEATNHFTIPIVAAATVPISLAAGYAQMCFGYTTIFATLSLCSILFILYWTHHGEHH